MVLKICSMEVIQIKLQEFMNKKNISQGKLSQCSGVSQSCISQLVSGKKYPRLSTMEKLASALGVTVSELIGEKPKRKKTG